MDIASPFVSRGGLKLAAALDAFSIDVTGLTCADLGCNVGGFSDCLLQRGAGKVYSVDTGYGTLAWKLRNDARVVVLERTNAVHFDPRNPRKPDPKTIAGFAGCDLVTIDLGWTRQRHAIPAALRWLSAGGASGGVSGGASGGGRIVTLIKPHYEATQRAKRGVLDESAAGEVLAQTLAEMPALGVRVLGHIVSPIRGGAGKGKLGNLEYLALLAVA